MASKVWCMKGLFKKSKYLNNKLEEKMKKSVSILIIIFNFIFTSCFTIPGYVDKDGNITPPYLKEIKIEALKGNLSGLWSRRIDDKNRIIYEVTSDIIQIHSLRGHYLDK